MILKSFFVIFALFVVASSAFALDRKLGWTDTSSAPNAEDGFAIQSCPGTCGAAGPWTDVGKVGPNVTQFTIINVPIGATTSYRVIAFNVAGATPSAPFVDAVPGVPSAPGNVNAPGIVCNGMQLLTNPDTGAVTISCLP